MTLVLNHILIDRIEIARSGTYIHIKVGELPASTMTYSTLRHVYGDKGNVIMTYYSLKIEHNENHVYIIIHK